MKYYETSLCPFDPDNFWIDTGTNERVNAYNGQRTAPMQGPQILWSEYNAIQRTAV